MPSQVTGKSEVPTLTLPLSGRPGATPVRNRPYAPTRFVRSRIIGGSYVFPRASLELNGPSLYRMSKTLLAGWKRYKDSPDERVRERFARKKKTQKNYNRNPSQNAESRESLPRNQQQDALRALCGRSPRSPR
jgi:hypothetical protein